MSVRGAFLRVFSAAASAAVLMLPAQAHDTPVPHDHLPPVTVTPSDATPPKQEARTKQRQNRGARTRTVVRPVQPQPSTAGSSGVTPAASSDDAGALQPTAASAMRISGEQVNAVPFARPGEALEVVPGLIVTQHSGEGKANQYLPLQFFKWMARAPENYDQENYGRFLCLGVSQFRLP